MINGSFSVHFTSKTFKLISRSLRFGDESSKCRFVTEHGKNSKFQNFMYCRLFSIVSSIYVPNFKVTDRKLTGLHNACLQKMSKRYILVPIDCHFTSFHKVSKKTIRSLMHIIINVRVYKHAHIPNGTHRSRFWDPFDRFPLFMKSNESASYVS